MMRGATTTADVVWTYGGGTIGRSEQVDVVFEESDYGRGFEEPGDVFVAAFAVAFFAEGVAFGVVGFCQRG